MNETSRCFHNLNEVRLKSKEWQITFFFLEESSFFCVKIVNGSLGTHHFFFFGLVMLGLSKLEQLGVIIVFEYPEIRE